MKIRELLDLISRVAKIHHLPEPFICGGVVRDRILGTLTKNLKDLDITNADSSIKNLAEEVYRALSKSYAVERKQMNDGHTTIFLGKSFSIDFSSNYIVPGIEDLFKQQGIKSTSIKKEMFSRDFTINSLLLSTDFKRVLDPTKQGIQDIKNKILRTCLDPATTLSVNPNRAIRVVYLAAKLGFTVDPPIIEFLKSHKDLFSKIDPGYLSRTLEKAIKHNKETTIKLLDQMDLWGSIKVPEELHPEYAQRFLKKSQLKRNFDYGEGLYFGDMDRYKSVMDYRKKNKKKRKKVIKKIRDMKFK